MSRADIIGGRAIGIAHKMNLEALIENKPNHVIHV